ncbi:hypothetical protein D3C71_1179250 [compost metagenome]
MAHRVIDQQLTNQVVNAEVGPAGTCQLAQVVTGPLALPQPNEYGTRLPFTECLAVTRWEQELTVIPFGPLNLAIADEHLAHLLSQRQAMLDAGLGVLGRNEPLALGQADV